MSITIYKTVDVEVDVDVGMDDIAKAVEHASEKEKAAIAAKLFGGGVPFGLGDGDAERAATLIERAFLAAKSLPSCPPEIAEMFWVVHGRAMA
ncbi:hypothetical protein AB8810_10930 [Xanthomonas sp. NCPPB 3005]|uniref:hypothetical protein n=1 Tax=Xanthomonas sp. NCPPB 3005 TaxID=3240913 RepID=UPI0035189FB7